MSMLRFALESTRSDPAPLLPRIRHLLCADEGSYTRRRRYVVVDAAVNRRHPRWGARLGGRSFLDDPRGSGKPAAVHEQRPRRRRALAIRSGAVAHSLCHRSNATLAPTQISSRSLADGRPLDAGDRDHTLVQCQRRNTSHARLVGGEGLWTDPGQHRPHRPSIPNDDVAVAARKLDRRRAPNARGETDRDGGPCGLDRPRD